VRGELGAAGREQGLVDLVSSISRGANCRTGCRSAHASSRPLVSEVPMRGRHQVCAIRISISAWVR
jgi:hypothetical protein